MDRFEELHKGRLFPDTRELVASVKIHDLPEQRHLAHTARDKALDLLHNVGDRARTLRATRARHDAEGAVHIAALHDAHERRDLPVLQHVLADRALRTRLLRDVHDAETRVVHEPLAHRDFPLHELLHVVGDLVEFLRADDEVHMRDVAHEFAAAALRHAAEKAEDHLGLVCAQAAEQAHFSERLLFREIAHAARVDEHDIRRLFLRRELIAATNEIARDLLGVALVHLASVGFEKYFRHRRARKLAEHAALVNGECGATLDVGR